MTRSLDAIYENGSFRPLQAEPLGISNGQRVRITVNDEVDAEALRLAVQVYEGLSDKDIADIEQISLNRSDFFGPRSAS